MTKATQQPIQAKPVTPFRVRTPYNYDVDLVSRQTGLHCTDPTRAQQQFQDECDINTIMRKFAVTKTLPLTMGMPTYDDYTDAVTDYQTAQNAIIQAKQAFQQLPARVRDRFQNNPQHLLEFVMDKTNKEEAEKLGLLAIVPQQKEEVKRENPT